MPCGVSRENHIIRLRSKSTTGPDFDENKLGLSCAKLMLSLTSKVDMLGLLSPVWIIFDVQVK